MSRSNFSADSEKIILKIEPSKSSFLPYVFGILFGLILIIITISFDFKFNTLNYYLVLMAIIFYLIIDHGYRQRNNVRLIELKEKSLNVYKGKKMLKESIQLSKVIDIRSKKRFLSVIVTLRLETPGREKGTSFLISSDTIHNSDLIKLSEEIKRLKGGG
jgi:hypothetical protein